MAIYHLFVKSISRSAGRSVVAAAAYRVGVALSAELDADARKELAGDFARELVACYGVVADVAIHEPGREGDNRNHHAHILTTTRTAGADGLGAKTRVLDVASTASAEIEHMRGVWVRQVNMALERHQIEQRLERERETERQRQELVRQAEIRRQQDIRAAEEVRKAAELERQKQHQQEIEQVRTRGLSRGLSRGRDYDSGPGMGF